MSKEKIFKEIKDILVSNKVDIKNADPTGSELLIKQRDFNIILNSSKEVRLSNIVNRIDLQAPTGNYAIIDNENDDVLHEMKEEIEDIPEETLEAAVSSSVGLKRFSDIVKVKSTTFNFAPNVAKVVLQVLTQKYINTENRELIKTLKDKVAITLTSHDEFLTVVNNNLDFDSVYSNQMICNYSYYKGINTKENIKDGVLKIINGQFYYNNIPLYVIKDTTSLEAIPVAYVGNMSKATNYIYDKNSSVLLAVDTMSHFLNQGYKTRFTTYFNTKIGIADKYIKLTVGA